MWVAWLFTVALAAVAAAITFFVIMHRQYTFYEATHDSFWRFMLDVLPYLWIVVFVVSATLALYHLRSTKRGYRYPLWGIIVTSVFASIAGGSLLHYYGMSYVLDHELGEYMPGYRSQAALEKQFWQMPSEGRLLVTYLREADSGSGVIVEDVLGVKWFTNIDELYARDLELLRSGATMRLLGTIPGETEILRFHACGVFPWMYDHVTSMDDMYKDREEAIARLRQHQNRTTNNARVVVPPMDDADSRDMMEFVTAEAQDRPLEEIMITDPAATKDPQCQNIKAIKRLTT